MVGWGENPPDLSRGESPPRGSPKSSARDRNLLNQAELKTWIERLESQDESVRLKAANTFVKADADQVRAAIPALRKVFQADSNPAVRFLAKKALGQLGEDLEVQAHSSTVLPTARTSEVFHVLQDGKALWRTCLELLSDNLEILFSMLFDPDPEVQEGVARCLEALGPQVIGARLLRAFLDTETMAFSGDNQGEDQAAEALSRSELEEASHLAELKAAELDLDTVAAMGNFKIPEVFQVLVDMLRSRHLTLARGGLVILGSLREAQIVPPLIHVLGRKHPSLDAPILGALQDLAGRDRRLRRRVARVLEKVLVESRDSRVRIQAIRGLGRLQEMGSLEVLRNTLEECEDPSEGTELILALSDFESLPPAWLSSNLRPLLHSSKPKLRAVAAVLLAGTPGWIHAEKVVQELKDSSVRDRTILAQALASARHSDLAPYLEEILSDSEPSVRQVAAEGLAEVQSSDLLEGAGSLLTHPDPKVAGAVAEAVGRLGLDSFNGILSLVLDQLEEDSALAKALLALGQLGLEEDLPTIAHFLGSDSEAVRAAAVEALESQNLPQSMSLVQLSFSDDSPEVVGRAVRAVFSWGETRPAVQRLRELLVGDEAERAAGAKALAEISAKVRNESRLIDSTLLITALRQHPRYLDFAKIASAVSGR